jgi:hypothetical protein
MIYHLSKKEKMGNFNLRPVPTTDSSAKSLILLGHINQDGQSDLREHLITWAGGLGLANLIIES